MSLLRRFSQNLVAWVLPRPRFILAAALLSVIGSLWLAAVRLEVRTDQLELISTRNPLIAKSQTLDEFNFHGKTTFALVVRGPTQDRAIEFMNAIVSKIQADPEHFQDVFYRINPDEFKKWLLYYLDEDDLVTIRNTLEKNSVLVHKMAENPDLLNFFELVNRDMASRMVGEFFTGFLDEEVTPQGPGKEARPLDLEFLIKVLDGFSGYLSGSKYASPWSSFFKSGAWDLEKEGYLWEGKKKLLIAEVMPAKVSGQVSKTLKSLAQLRNYIHELRASGFSDVEAGVTGQEALNNDEMSTAMADMTNATWLSMLGVLLIMVLFLRGFRHPVIILISLAVGLCWTFGWTAIFIGHLNILSIVFAPMLCGLGVDYAIHWFARFEEERDLADGTRSAVIRRVMDKSGPGIMLAGLSTAFSFLPFILTGFRGLMELGMITGMGILLIILADFTVLPALSHYLAVEKPPVKRSSAQANNRYLLRLGPRGVRTILALALIFCIAGSLSASRVRFDLNPLRLQSKNAESVYWEKVLVENSDRSIISAAILTDSPEEVMKESAKFKALRTVSHVDNIFTLLPDDQEEKMPVLCSIALLVPELQPPVLRLASKQDQSNLDAAADACDGPSYKAGLIEVLQRIRFKMQDEQAREWGASKPLVEQMVKVRKLIDGIVQALDISSTDSERLFKYRRHFEKDIVEQWTLIKESSSASPMGIHDLPSQLRDQFLQGNQYLVRIYPREPIWEEGTLTRFVNDIQSVNPDVLGDPVYLYVFASAFKKASINASIYALIAISVLLAFTFRSLRLMLISLIPLVAGTIWTVGIMAAAGFDFNLANSIFMPLVVGAGVEYGVIILQRWREGPAGYGRLPFSTGKGVILASLTTTIGFGTLMISNHRGIFSLGFVAWAGSICVVVAALFILPAILSFMPAPVADKEAINARR
ncbi:MAG: MMPL family transporter [Syntrophobacteraceae bacterium]|jgi:hopanoid biosynthesis associated RND transporter like protein HpnN